MLRGVIGARSRARAMCGVTFVSISTTLRTRRGRIMPGDEVEKVSQLEGSGQGAEEFEKASREQQVSLAREFLEFLGDNKKWWLLPIVLVLLLFGVLVLFSGTAAAPFIYTLF
jgi:hypothetical protein